MKKINLFVLLALMSITSIAIGQNDDIDNREKFTFGIKSGLNYSNVYNSKTEQFRADSKFGFVGGVMISIPVNRYFSIQPEVLLSQKGFKGDGVFLGVEYSFTRTTTFIDIPIQLAIKPSEFITVVAGPQYSYLIKQKDEFKSSFINTSYEEEFNNDNIRRNILGVVAGLDINIRHIVIGARVAWDMVNNNGNGSSNTPRYKNMWYQATIGYIFYRN